MEREPDPDKLKLFSFVLYSQLSGAVTAGMVHLGDRLGLYRVLAAADSPLNSADIAARSGLHERWIREWTANQVAARLLDADHSDPTDPRFSLSPEARAVLADETHPAFGMGMFHCPSVSRRDAGSTTTRMATMEPSVSKDRSNRGATPTWFRWFSPRSMA